MRHHRQELINNIIFMHAHAFDALAAAVLQTIGIDWNPFDIAIDRHRDHNVFLRNQIFILHINFRVDDFRTALIIVFFLDFRQFGTNDFQNPAMIVQNIF